MRLLLPWILALATCLALLQVAAAAKGKGQDVLAVADVEAQNNGHKHHHHHGKKKHHKKKHNQYCVQTDLVCGGKNTDRVICGSQQFVPIPMSEGEVSQESGKLFNAQYHGDDCSPYVRHDGIVTEDQCKSYIVKTIEPPEPCSRWPPIEDPRPFDGSGFDETDEQDEDEGKKKHYHKATHPWLGLCTTSGTPGGVPMLVELCSVVGDATACSTGDVNGKDQCRGGPVSNCRSKGNGQYCGSSFDASCVSDPNAVYTCKAGQFPKFAESCSTSTCYDHSPVGDIMATAAMASCGEIPKKCLGDSSSTLPRSAGPIPILNPTGQPTGLARTTNELRTTDAPTTTDAPMTSDAPKTTDESKTYDVARATKAPMTTNEPITPSMTTIPTAAPNPCNIIFDQFKDFFLGNLAKIRESLGAIPVAGMVLDVVYVVVDDYLKDLYKGLTSAGGVIGQAASGLKSLIDIVEGMAQDITDEYKLPVNAIAKILDILKPLLTILQSLADCLHGPKACGGTLTFLGYAIEFAVPPIRAKRPPLPFFDGMIDELIKNIQAGIRDISQDTSGAFVTLTNTLKTFTTLLMLVPGLRLPLKLLNQVLDHADDCYEPGVVPPTLPTLPFGPPTA
ncbi:hypothetical protein BG006_003082 [Podila minutissima]|uniref:Uncharacterized protein n=1 Tax=Podila minutissima TaxID=64525 RepID=A0A9P5SVB7_9FUNG|nr:hypothetical protein BG006_003082 [Podila minutissima]